MLNRILDKMPEIRMSVISMLLKPQYLKIAIKLVADYNFDPEQFPLLMQTVIFNTSNYFISKVFRAEGHPDHMPLHKVEDLFTDRPRFLIPLVEALLKKSRKQREFAYDDEGEEEFNPNYL